MDVKTRFRNLVTNKKMQSYNYVNDNFSFKTLFHQSPYSYCCCPCGFEHEYIDYISEDGVINEDMYQKILRCILDGKCPHVDDAPSEKYVRETHVYAIHVAAAVGTVNAVKNITRGYYFEIKGGIYGLDPLQIAVLKSQSGFAKRTRQHCKEKLLQTKPIFNEPNIYDKPLYVHKLSYATRLSHDNNSIDFEKVHIPSFCIRTANRSLLKVMLDPTTFFHSNVYEDLELAYNKKLEDMCEELLTYVCALRYGHSDIRTWCAISAVVHEQDHHLKAILGASMSGPNPCINTLTRQLPTVCDIFGKHNQKAIVDCFVCSFFCPVGMYCKASVLHYLIKHYTEDFEKEIKDATDKLYQSHEAANDKNIKSGRLSLLHYFLDGSEVDPHHAEVLIKLGANVDAVRIFKGRTGNIHKTVLQALLQKKLTKNKRNIYSILVLLIFESPDTNINMNAVDDGIDLDETFATEVVNIDIAGNYVMDATEHTCFSGDEFALNFIGPLLIECGFYWSRNTLLGNQERRLHPAEKEYLNYVLNNPRSLKLSCRDVLRRHFKRRAIYDFVNNSVIPEKIKDYILIKRVLTQSRTLH